MVNDCLICGKTFDEHEVNPHAIQTGWVCSECKEKYPQDKYGWWMKGIVKDGFIVISIIPIEGQFPSPDTSCYPPPESYL